MGGLWEAEMNERKGHEESGWACMYVRVAVLYRYPINIYKYYAKNDKVRNSDRIN